MRTDSTLLVLLFLFFSISSALPVSSSDENVSEATISSSTLYKLLPVDEIPTKIGKDVILGSSDNHTRYGYFVVRPVTRMFRGIIGRFFLNHFAKTLTKMPPLLHWTVLISDEPPSRDAVEPGQKVRPPETGTLYELRIDSKPPYLYLSVKNWTSYIYHPEKIEYLGQLNRTDEELVKIGRVYIQHIGKEGFHSFYRNCQHFASWYIQDLFPDRKPTATRADQVFGKFLWWFKDFGKTARWGGMKIKELLGFKKGDYEEIDSSTEFINVDELLGEN